MDLYQNITDEMKIKNSEILYSYTNKFQNVLNIDFKEIKNVLKNQNNNLEENPAPPRLYDYFDCSKKKIILLIFLLVYMNKYSDEMQMKLKDNLLISLYGLFISSFILFLFNILYAMSALFTVKFHNRYLDMEKIKID